MGNCIAASMERSNRNSLIPDPTLQAYMHYGVENIPIPDTETSNSTPVYRHAQYGQPGAHEELIEKNSGVCITQRLKETCATYKNEQRIAFRPVQKKSYAEVMGKRVEVTHLGPTNYLSLGELWKNIENFGRGLKEIGVAPRSNVCIYEDTRWEWLASIYGIWSMDAVASTVYANLGEDALCYALRETECSAIICNGKNVPLLLKSVAAGRFPACRIIYLDGVPGGVPSNTYGCDVRRWEDVVELGAASSQTVMTQAAENWDDLALIMYTSGTTGDPKGVMHSHGSLTAGTRALELLLLDILPAASSVDGESYCAYLPLAHVLEFGVVNVFLSRGAVVGFGSPRTLTDVTTRPHGDLKEFQPRCLVSVPRVFDTIRRAVEAKLPPPGSFKRRIFDNAYNARLQAIKDGNDTPYYNEKVFQQPRALFGGKVKLLLSGGGPMSASTKEFVSVVFGNIVNGWGLTETMCVGGVQRLGDQHPTSCGQVLPMNEIKLVDTQDYKHTDSPEPRGELCIRGPFLFKGYYKQPELTKEAIDEDGWFHTGDVGSVSADGRISVIGRIKALAKNCLGEYIALETLESIYAGHPLVLNNCICVIVHPDRNYIGAVLVTDEAKVKAFAADCGEEFQGIPVGDLIADPNFCDVVARSVARLGRSAKRCPFELPRRVFITLEEWTPENEMLTVAMKLKRRCVEEKFKKEIDAMFASE